jgi:hypothetical protein
MIALTGQSNSSPPLSAGAAATSGLSFQTSACGGSLPPSLTFDLTNLTNQSVGYTATMGAGTTFFTFTDPGSGTVGASAANTFTVSAVPQPLPTIPGPVNDTLTITTTAGTGATLVIPITWTLQGARLAVLENPQGGPYLADSTGDVSFEVINFGNGDPVSIGFSDDSGGAITYGVASPLLVSGGTSSANVSLTASGSGTVYGCTGGSSISTLSFTAPAAGVCQNGLPPSGIAVFVCQ